MKELFRRLKEANTHVEIDSIATTLSVMLHRLNTLHPETNGHFRRMAMQLSMQLEALRAQRESALEVFGGNGPVAKKLREHLTGEMWLHGESCATRRKLQELDAQFNFHPTGDEQKLAELSRFIDFTRPFMNGVQVDEAFFVDARDEQNIKELPCGFYVNRSTLVPVYLLVLNAMVDGVGVSFVMPAGQDAQIFFHHPNEDEWFRADGTYTFEHLASVLATEFDQVIAPLGFSTAAIDFEVELKRIYQQVDEVFDNEQQLRGKRVEGFRDEGEWSQIVITLGTGYSWVFTNTKGDHPSRSRMLVCLIGGCLQSIDPGSLNEFSRQSALRLCFEQIGKIRLAMNNDDEKQAA